MHHTLHHWDAPQLTQLPLQLRPMCHPNMEVCTLFKNMPAVCSSRALARTSGHKPPEVHACSMQQHIGRF